jgi:hypothetical protein
VLFPAGSAREGSDCKEILRLEKEFTVLVVLGERRRSNCEKEKAITKAPFDCAPFENLRVCDRAGEIRHEKRAYLIDIAINIFFRFLFRAFHLSCFRGPIVALLSAFLRAGFKAAPALLKQALSS